MSHIICSLLGLDDKQRLFSYGIDILEKSCPKRGVDTKLITDIISKSNLIIRQLNLNTKDTTGEELYYSLLSLSQQKEANDILSGADYVLKLYDNKTVSFNLNDIKKNNRQKISFSKQLNHNGRACLEKELVSRYRDGSNLVKSELDDIFGMMGLLTKKK